MTTAKKAKVKLNLKGSSVEEKLTLARQIVQALTANEQFPSPIPSLETVGSAIGELEKAHADVKLARQTVSTKYSILEDKSSELDAVLNQLGAYVESTAKGDEVKIKLAGMSVKASKTPTGIPSAPEGLLAVAANEKEIELSWDSVKGAKSYVVQLTSDLSKDESWSVSHPVITNVLSGGKVVFHFENIMLPDSTTNKDKAQGFVRFSIEPVKNLADETVIKNKAAIVFDQNAPVMTNEVYNTLVTKVPEDYLSIKDKKNNISLIYPNPANNYINVRRSEGTRVEVYDFKGKRILYSQSSSINTAEWQSGLYIFRILDINGDVLNTEKVLISK